MSSEALNPRIAVSASSPFVRELKHNFTSVRFASLVDPTYATGATLIYFPKGAVANFDARGGSVASCETTLLEEGSYGDNSIDGLVFSGGSTMGLAATDGVRQVLFQRNLARATDFDFIPSVPGAVVYDFGGRLDDNNDPYVYPGREFGTELTKYLSDDTVYFGRVGAGVTTSVNKIGDAYWGGQGVAFGKVGRWKVLAFVVMNSSGDVHVNGKSYLQRLVGQRQENQGRPEAKKNTTLSAIITDAQLDRSQLKRLSVLVHTNMAKLIDPFHLPEDGDINFALSTREKAIGAHPDDEFRLQQKAIALMREAIESSVTAANAPLLEKGE